MILGFSADTKSPGLDAWKYHSDEFSKGGRIKGIDSLSPASLRIVGIHTISRYRLLVMPAKLTQPGGRQSCDP